MLSDNFFEEPANHRTSILKHDVLTQHDIDLYYQKFTQIREDTYLKRYGQYLSSEHREKVNAIMEDSAQKG